MARQMDPELKAMQAVVDVLEDMDMASALRVLEWARYRVMTPRIGQSGFAIPTAADPRREVLNRVNQLEPDND